MLLFESLRWTLYVLGKELWDKSNVELISIHLTVLNSDINRLLSKSKNYPLIFHWYENFTFFCRTEWNGKVKLFFSQKSCCSNFRADTILICSCTEKIKFSIKDQHRVNIIRVCFWGLQHNIQTFRFQDMRKQISSEVIHQITMTRK